MGGCKWKYIYINTNTDTDTYPNTNTSLHMGSGPKYLCVDRNKCKSKYMHLNTNTDTITYKLHMVAAPNFYYLLLSANTCKKYKCALAANPKC